MLASCESWSLFARFYLLPVLGMSTSTLAPSPCTALDFILWDIPWGDEYEGYRAGSLPGADGWCTFHQSSTSPEAVDDSVGDASSLVRISCAFVSITLTSAVCFIPRTAPYARVSV